MKFLAAMGSSRRCLMANGDWHRTRSTRPSPRETRDCGRRKASLMDRLSGALTGEPQTPFSNYSLVSARGKRGSPHVRGSRGRDDRPCRAVLRTSPWSR